MSDDIYNDTIQEIVSKLKEINHLTLLLPLKMRHDVYASAKRHFYIGQCLTNKQLKDKKNVKRNP